MSTESVTSPRSPKKRRKTRPQDRDNPILLIQDKIGYARLFSHNQGEEAARVIGFAIKEIRASGYVRTPTLFRSVATELGIMPTQFRTALRLELSRGSSVFRIEAEGWFQEWEDILVKFWVAPPPPARPTNQTFHWSPVPGLEEMKEKITKIGADPVLQKAVVTLFRLDGLKNINDLLKEI